MRSKAARLLAVLAVACFAVHAVSLPAHGEAGASAVPAPTPSASAPYLLLITFAGKNTPQEMSVVKNSPYDGVGVMIGTAYDEGPAPSEQSLEPKFMQLKSAAGNKDVWPWVFINRMVGTNPNENNAQARKPYFQSIRAMDLDNKAGAKQAFLDDWRVALQLAKHMGSPGVVLDLEYYNNYFISYAVSRLADARGESQDRVIQEISQLGAQMADIANQELPDGKIWCLVTALAYPQMVRGQAIYPTRAYVPIGIMQRLKQLHSRIQFIDGGEDSLGYCHTTLDDLKQDIRTREQKHASLEQEFSGIFQLGGTITLWSDASVKQGWMRQGKCGTSSARNLDDLEPYLEELTRAYPYVWVYAAPVGGYDPFNPQVASKFHATVDKAKHSQ